MYITDGSKPGSIAFGCPISIGSRISQLEISLNLTRYLRSEYRSRKNDERCIVADTNKVHTLMFHLGLGPCIDNCRDFLANNRSVVRSEERV
jgi:hypothetical protein